MSTRAEDTLLRIAQAVAEGSPVDWAREDAAQPELRPQLERLQVLERIAALHSKEPGQTLSHYRLIEKIGEGGMGVVWSAEDTTLRRKVALKLLSETSAANAEHLTRFEREARFLASLNHPNIAAIHGLEEAEGERFLVLELVPGNSLAQRLTEGPLPVAEALRVCSEMAKALEAAHDQGIIHRDLKPHNVMITPEGKVKVLDFGVAKVFGAPAFASEIAARPAVTEVTREHATLGTTPYMSPEQASAKPLDKRTDIWAFGCTLYEALSGRKAFPGENVESTLAAIHGQEPDWERLPTETPARIRELLRRCLAKDLDSRLRDIGDARLEIEQALGELATQPAAETAQPAAKMALSGSAGVAPLSLFAELKRRNVIRVGAAYAIVAWLLIEVASVVLPTFNAPEWVMQAFTFLVILGLPLALILAWAFELTPEGIRFEKAVNRSASISQQTGRRLNHAIIVLLGLSLFYVVMDKYVLEAGPEQASAVREKSIAVLPFDNISPNPEDTYFTDGIHDEILAQLSKIRDLKVISRTSVMGYSGRNRPPLPEIAAALGVANILEGSVRLAGNRVRITTQLIEAESDAHLWAETYDRELTAVNIFAIQSEIAKTVADALRATLSPEEQDRLATVPTENLEAYQAYLLGKQRLANRTTASLAEAFDYFEQAIELDPNFALAYVGLADTYIWQSGGLGFPQQETLAKAQGAVDKALALDDGLGEAYSSLAGIKWGRGDFEAAEATFRRALELNPNYATAYSWYGDLLLVLGRVEEALAMHRRALALDPLSVDVIRSVGDDLWGLGQFDEALPWYEKAIEVDPRYATAYLDIALYHALVLGQLDESVVWNAKAISLDPGEAGFQAVMGLGFLSLGDVGKAEYWIQRSIELGPEVGLSNFAMLALNLRRKDASSLDFARKTIASFPNPCPSRMCRTGALAVLRNHELREGRPAEARALYERFSPELLSEADPIIDNDNYGSAIDLALVLIRTGEQERADLLLSRSLEYIQTIPRLGFGYGIDDVQIYALQGEKQKALSALRQAIDEGWRVHWWYFLKHNPNLEPLHDEPEFQAMVAEIEADMAAQLARVREMERNGELEPIPEVSATAQ